MNDLLAKYLAVVEDVDADKSLSIELRFGMYRTFYKSLIEDIKRYEEHTNSGIALDYIMVSAFSLLYGMLFGIVLR